MTDTMPPPSDEDGEARRKRVGAYAKLLANYASDDAIIDAGEAAELLFVRGLAFCATSDADGYITDAQVLRYVGAGMRDTEKRARKLVQVGVWERVDGGYIVRSWLKIHESTAKKGRRRKADRERKAKKPVRPDSDDTSERIPGGIQTEGVSESLSDTEQEQSSATQGTTEHGSKSLGEHRNETLPAPSAPKLSQPTNPAAARCTDHVGVAEPGPCRGCKLARENAETEWQHWQAGEARQLEAAIKNCPDCHGSNWRENPDGSVAGKCNHERALRLLKAAS